MQVHVCTWKSCSLKYSKYIIARLENDITFCKYKNLEVHETACLWECKKWPNIKIGQEKINYVSPVKASEMIAKKIQAEKKSAEKKHLTKKKK